MLAGDPRGMMMTIKGLTYTLAYFLLIFFTAPGLQGQVKDFQSWWELEFNKEVSGRLDLNAEIEQRLKNNSLQYSRTLFTLGATYDVLDFLRLGGGARAVLVMDGEQEIHARYRLHLDGLGTYDLEGYDLSLRARFQYGFQDNFTFRYMNFKGFVNRYRLKVAHHIFGTRFGWFASVESWHGASAQSRWLTNGIRYSAGLRFSPGFTSRFSLRYILEDEFNVVNPKLLHVVVAGYTYRF